MTDALVEAVRDYTNARGGVSPFVTAIEGLVIFRSDHEKPQTHVIFRPSLCIVVQGAKWSMFGDKRLDYRAGQALVVTVEMPSLSRVAEASPDEPYLGVIIQFDLAVMREVFERLNPPPKLNGNLGSGVFVTNFAGPMADCVLRMVRLLGTPDAIPTLAPLLMRELSYWLLTGPHGGEIARIVLANSHAQRVVSAIHALRDRFTEPIRIGELAQTAGMSSSAFHRQFKSITSMTPLQYQKQLRLLEARRLIVNEAANAETAAYQVGYESPSQFSREYARKFGAPPRRDAVLPRARAS